MSFASHKAAFTEWLNENMVKGGNDVSGRLVTAMALLERLRETPTLDLKEHMAGSGQQLVEHNGFVDRAIARFSVQSPVQERGRRSSNLNAWANSLFAWLVAAGFREGEIERNDDLLQGAQAMAACRLSLINEDKPLIARYSKGSAVAVIGDILDQAQEKKRAKDVAEYLVGAKLELRFGEGAVQPKNVNTPSLDQLADFRFGGAAFEVTTVTSADSAHLNKIGEILSNTGLELWLLTRKRDREKWQKAVDAKYGDQASRVVVTDIETFVGQNTSEIGHFEAEETRATLAALFARYTNRWLPMAGAGGLRIVDPEAYGE
ncbi:MAG: DUF4928 family protein [Planctomycetia bacterium]|nr:DUF4928 family protein [Planctomycetia bacterium]